jgi:glycosyltransferase involved in cell wall biosynthesis
MKVLILTTHLNPGGISRYVINLAKGLKERGVCVWVACSKGRWVDKLSERGIGYKFIPINTKSILSPKVFICFFLLIPFIQKEKIQIVHANTRVTQFLAYLLYKFLNISYVSSFHGFYRPTIFRKMFKFCGARTIAVSKAVKMHLVNDLKIDRKKINVVYNGIDTQEFSSYRKRNKTEFNFKEKDCLLGILGRISEEKGHLLAIEAFKHLYSHYNRIYLLFNGRGKFKKNVEEVLRREKLADRVKFMDLIPEEFLEIIDILIVPSKKEGFGYSILEAFAKEVAVVGFNTGGISEIIKDKKNGILFYKYNSYSLKRAIEEIMKNDDLKEKIIKEAKNSLSYFTIEKMATATHYIYHSVLKGN